MSSMSDPYAPPKDGPTPPAVPPLEEGVVTCTVLLTEAEVTSALAMTAKPLRWTMTVVAALIGFMVSLPGAPGLQPLIAAVCAALGWWFSPKLFIFNARKSLANKSEAERTFAWRFSPDGYEVTTAESYSRAKWSTIHRFLEGPTCFVLYASEAVVHILPKQTLRAEDQSALRAMLTSRITPRKKPSIRSKLVWVVVVYILLILVFLANWQFLQTGR